MRGRTCNAPVGVQDRTARRLAGDGLVQDLREVFTRLEGGVEGGDWYDCAGCLYPGRWPDVPRQTHAYMRSFRAMSRAKYNVSLTIALLDVLEVHVSVLRINGERGRVESDGRVQGAYQTLPVSYLSKTGNRRSWVVYL